MGVLSNRAAQAGAAVAEGLTGWMGTTFQHQEAARREAQVIADQVAGGAAMDIGESGVVPAQFIPGRGAETPYTRMNILSPIRFKTGESPGPKLTSAYGRERMFYKAQNAMHAFAFKMQ